MHDHDDRRYTEVARCIVVLLLHSAWLPMQHQNCCCWLKKMEYGGGSLGYQYYEKTWIVWVLFVSIVVVVALVVVD